MNEPDDIITTIITDINEFFATPNAFRSVLLLVLSMAVAFMLSNVIAKLIVKIAQNVSVKGENESDEARAIRYRQIETYLSITIAVVRATLALVVGYLVWLRISETANSSIAAISASTIFLVFAGQTLGMFLRDIAAGSAMIIERWFNVGDFVKLEPYWDVQGVVERFTLRSTKIRALNGEVIWVHNQNITGVHVTPRGLRTMAVDVFMSDHERGEAAIKEIIRSMPKGKLMLASPLKITQREDLSENLTHFTVVGQTAPGREWLIETWFVEALKDLDDEETPRRERLLVMDPIQRYADPEAEKRFRRAVRVNQEKH